jgi:hypothetical protein
VPHPLALSLRRVVFKGAGFHLSSPDLVPYFSPNRNGRSPSMRDGFSGAPPLVFRGGSAHRVLAPSTNNETGVITRKFALMSSCGRTTRDLLFPGFPGDRSTRASWRGSAALAVVILSEVAAHFARPVCGRAVTKSKNLSESLGCPTLLALPALSPEGSLRRSSLRVSPSALAHALRLGFVAQPLLAVLLTGAGRLSLRQSRSVVSPNSVLLDFLIFNYHYVAGSMHPVAI